MQLLSNSFQSHRHFGFSLIQGPQSPVGAVLAVTVAGVVAWQHLASWLRPLLTALRRVLGDQGALALGAVLFSLLVHRLQAGPSRLGCG